MKIFLTGGTGFVVKIFEFSCKKGGLICSIKKNKLIPKILNGFAVISAIGEELSKSDY